MILAILVIFVTLPFWITRNIRYSWDFCEICRLLQGPSLPIFFKVQSSKFKKFKVLLPYFFFKNKKISCYFCNYCKISRPLKAFLSFLKPKVLLNLWFLLVLWYLLPGLFSLLWFLQNLRTSQEPSLPSSLYEWTFVKFAIFAIFVVR